MTWIDQVGIPTAADYWFRKVVDTYCDANTLDASAAELSETQTKQVATLLNTYKDKRPRFIRWKSSVKDSPADMAALEWHFEASNQGMVVVFDWYSQSKPTFLMYDPSENREMELQPTAFADLWADANKIEKRKARQAINTHKLFGNDPWGDA